MKGNVFYALIFYCATTILLAGCGLADVPGKEDAQTENPKQPKKEKVKFTGVKESKYENGDIKSRVTFLDGRMHGKSWNYYQGGQVHSEFEYVDGKQEGVTKWYYEDGTLFQEIPYKRGVIQGQWKQYHENGQLQAELPYYQGEAGVGLKEYSSSGKLKTKYPKITIKEKDETVFNNKFFLTIGLTEKPNWVEYYYGELTEGKFLGLYMTKLPTDQNMNGVLELTIPKGQFIMKQIDVVARIKTSSGFYCLLHKTYNLSVENR